MKILRCLSGLFLCAYAATGFASVNNVGTYNLILQNDLSTSSDIEGRIMIGGNITSPSLDVGSRLAADPVVDAVTVVGNINAGSIKTQNGNIVYGDSNTLSSVENGGKKTYINNYTSELINNGSGVAIRESSSLLEERFDAVYQSVIQDSAYYSSLEANSTLKYIDMNASRFLTENVDGRVVFNITAEQLNKSSALDFDVTPAVPIIINVSGNDTLNISTKATGKFDKEIAARNVLWNFYEAKTLSFTDGWNGSILAPYADIVNSTGSFDGGVAAKSFSGSVQFHNKLLSFEPDGEVAIPAPPVFALLVFSALFTLRRRKHN